jgi:CRISPR-associated protein Csx17
MTTFDVPLCGCAPTPLASYLKALGILRLVAEQEDGDARGCWQAGHFLLRSRFDRDGLAHFFLHDYRPTPIIAPWNGGSGFFSGDNQSGIGPLQASQASRFAGYVDSIGEAKLTLVRLGIEASPKGDAKQELLTHLRASLSDHAVGWIDAAVLLATEQVLYPPLLGTGGNDGRLDFTNNFMQRLVALFDTQSGEPKAATAAFFDGAAFGEPVAGLLDAAIGQFAPGTAGGPNATSGFEGSSSINPWDFVLMLEGALDFAAAATRRFERSGSDALSFPFTVRATAAGAGHAALSDEGSSHGELWLPVWQRPARHDELRALFSEGRVTLGRRPARNGLDFVRAVSRLGVDRGIESFQRYGLLMRSGKAFLATPLNTIRVERRPQADRIDDLEDRNWLQSFRRFARTSEAPARLTSLARRLDQALFDMANGGGAAVVQAVLTVLGEALGYLARSPSAREKVRPVPRLRWTWVQAADDGTAEFRIAAALAGLGTDDVRMACHLAPLADDGRSWGLDHHRVVSGQGSLVDNLCAVLRRRLIDAERAGADDKPLAGPAAADLAAVGAFLADETDDRRIAALLGGLALITPPRTSVSSRTTAPHPAPAAYAVLKPLFTPDDALREAGVLAEGVALPIPREIVGQLLSGSASQMQKAVGTARRRARASGLGASFEGLSAAGIDGRRLAAALLIPITVPALRRLVEVAYPRPARTRPEPVPVANEELQP